jgi:hypothetical protein
MLDFIFDLIQPPMNLDIMPGILSTVACILCLFAVKVRKLIKKFQTQFKSLVK